MFYTIFKLVFDNVNTKVRNFQNFEILKQKKLNYVHYLEDLDEEEKILRRQLNKLSDKNINRVFLDSNAV